MFKPSDERAIFSGLERQAESLIGQFRDGMVNSHGKLVAATIWAADNFVGPFVDFAEIAGPGLHQSMVDYYESQQDPAVRDEFLEAKLAYIRKAKPDELRDAISAGVLEAPGAMTEPTVLEQGIESYRGTVQRSREELNLHPALELTLSMAMPGINKAKKLAKAKDLGKVGFKEALAQGMVEPKLDLRPAFRLKSGELIQGEVGQGHHEIIEAALQKATGKKKLSQMTEGDEFSLLDAIAPDERGLKDGGFMRGDRYYTREEAGRLVEDLRDPDAIGRHGMIGRDDALTTEEIYDEPFQEWMRAVEEAEASGDDIPTAVLEETGLLPRREVREFLRAGGEMDRAEAAEYGLAELWDETQDLRSKGD